MKFRNVKVPEGINVSRHSPVADLIIMSAGVVLICAVLAAAALLVGSYAGRYMPVSWENAMAEAVFGNEDAESGGGEAPKPEFLAAEAALQDIADRLAPAMALPEGLRITAHFIDSDEPNAFATLGGHIFVTSGLIARVPHENALAFVIAHEIAHAGNRDVAANLGGALLAQLVMAVVVGSSPDLAEGLVWGPNAVVLSTFSRAAERRADRDGLAAVAESYGHVAGADAFFLTLLQENGPTPGEEVLKFLNTHPLTAERIDALRELAKEQGWATEGEVTGLAEELVRRSTDG